MAETSERVKIPLPVFSGEREKFATWLTCMQAFAVTYGFDMALNDKTVTLPPTKDTKLDMTMPEGTRMAIGKSKNALAMSYLVHALRGDRNLQCIYASKMTDSTTGRAWVLMKKLRQKYAPEDLTSVAEYKLALKSVKFGKPNENPDKMFEKFASMHNRYAVAGVVVDWNDGVATVLGVLPEKYQMLLVKYATKKNNTQDTFDELESEVTQYFRLTAAGDSKVDNSDDKK
jgi:hypothetical protein